MIVVIWKEYSRAPPNHTHISTLRLLNRLLCIIMARVLIKQDSERDLRSRLVMDSSSSTAPYSILRPPSFRTCTMTAKGNNSGIQIGDRGGTARIRCSRRARCMRLGALSSRVSCPSHSRELLRSWRAISPPPCLCLSEHASSPGTTHDSTHAFGTGVATARDSSSPICSRTVWIYRYLSVWSLRPPSRRPAPGSMGHVPCYNRNRRAR